MAKKYLQLLMDEREIVELEKVAAYVGMDRPNYCRLVLHKFAKLKPENALTALTAIPADFFKKQG